MTVDKAQELFEGLQNPPNTINMSYSDGAWCAVARWGPGDAAVEGVAQSWAGALVGLVARLVVIEKWEGAR